MSFLRKLFGGRNSAPPAPETESYNGFTITATPFKADGQWQLSGIVSMEVDGVVKEHAFIRADKFSDRTQAVEFVFIKGRLIVDQLGTSVFD